MPSLFNNASWGGISAAIRLIFGMINLFVAIRLVGVSSYGYIALILSIATIYLTFSNSIYTIAVTHAADILQNQTSKLDLSTLFSAVWFFTLVSIVFIVTLAYLFNAEFIQFFVYWGNDQALAQQIKTSYFIIIFLLTCQLVSAANVTVIESLGRFDLAAKAQTFGPIVAAVMFLSIFTIGTKVSLSQVVAVYAAGALTDTLLTTFVRLRMGYWSAYTPQRNIISIMPSLLKEGLSLQGARLINVFVEPLNKYLLNLFVGPASVALYEVAMKVIAGIQGLFGGAFRTFLQLTNDMKQTSGLAYLKSLQYGLVPALILHSIAGIAIILISKFWFYNESLELPLLFFMIIPASIIIIFIAPLYFTLIAIRDLGFIFKMNLNLAIINVIGSLVFIPFLGILGCAIGFTIAILFNAIMEFKRYIHKVGPIPALKNEVIKLVPKLLSITATCILSIIASIALTNKVYLIGFEVIMLLTLFGHLAKEPIINKVRNLFLQKSTKYSTRGEN